MLVQKHVGLALQLQKGIKARSLLEVSELEQEMACNSAFREHTEQLRELLANAQVRADDALRLLMIYALRYERNQSADAAIEEFTAVLRAKEGGAEVAHLVGKLRRYAGVQQRASDLFDDGTPAGEPGQKRGLMAKAKQAAKRAAEGMKGQREVENIYTQHEPLAKRTVEALYQGKLSESLFPYAPRGQQPGTPGFKAKEVIVFFCGGATCEESRALHELLEERVEERGKEHQLRFPGCKVLLGCTDMLRTETFLEYVAALPG